MSAAATLREELARLEAAGRLQVVEREVDPRFEIAAVARTLDRGPAVMFRRVRGHELPVVVGTMSDRRDIARSLGVEPGATAELYDRAIGSPVAPVVVDRGPVQEVVGTGAAALAELPIVTHFERDAGPYVTSGVVIGEDPADGVRNLSYHRMQVTGPDRLNIVIVRRHLHRLQQRAEAEGRPLPVAVAIGLPAAVRLAAGTSGSAIPFGFDELGIAGGLVGRPIELVRCTTSDVHVPAEAEIVLEGEVLPNARADEGPFAEFDGTYEGARSHVFRLRAVTRRRDAIYQTLLSGGSEQLEIMGFANEPVILRTVRGGVPNARAINVTSGGLRKFHAILSIDVQHPGDGKDAILAVLAAHRDVKHVVVVDADVDPFDLRRVEWAIATRFQADRDLVVVSGGRANDVDASIAPDGQTARMGLDATRRVGNGVGAKGEVARIPGLEGLDLAVYGLPR